MRAEDTTAASPAMRGVAVAAIAVAGFLFSLTPLAERLDNALLDAQWSVLRKFAPKPAPDEIVIVGIDESTARALEEPPGLWHRPLGAALERIAAVAPRAIGLYVVLPERSYESFRPGLDRPLFEGLAAARRNGPLVAALAIDAASRAARPIHTPFLAVLGDEGIGIGLLGRDEDGPTRRFAVSLPTEDGSFPTFAGRLCRALSPRCSEGLIDYSLGGPYEVVSLRQVLENRHPDFLRNVFRDRIVLIGEVQRYGDRIAVPVNLAGWENGGSTSPAVVVHAQSLRSALHGAASQASRPWVMVVVALAAGLALLRPAAILPAWALLAALALMSIGLVLLHGGTYVPLAAGLATLGAVGLLGAVRAFRGRRRPPGR